MGPRGLTLPPASTNSAKAFRSAFYCELCAKGYSRQNEFDTHESSYDHQHKKRLKEMKTMQKQAAPPSVRGRQEKGPLMQIKLGSAVAGGGGGAAASGAGGKSISSSGDMDAAAGGRVGGKKGGFKSAFGSSGEADGDGDGDENGRNGDGDVIGDESLGGKGGRGRDAAGPGRREAEDDNRDGSDDSDHTDEEDYYDPRKPTDCMPGCQGRIKD